MFDYYIRIQQIIKGEGEPRAKAEALYSVLTEIKNVCGGSLGLSPEGQFISTDSQNTKAGEIADHLKEAIIASDWGDIAKFKLQIIQYFYGNEELRIADIENLFNSAQLEDRGEEYNKTAVKKLYKNWVLQNKDAEIQWDKLLGDNFIDQSSGISSDTSNIKSSDGETVFVKNNNSNTYETGHLLTDQEVRMLTWSKIVKETNVTLKEAIKDHYVGIVGNQNLLQNPYAKQQYNDIMLEALANVKKSGKPSFISFANSGHWTTVSIVPNPSKKDEVAIVYLDSMNSGLLSDYAQVAHDLKTFIDDNKWLGVTLKPQDVFDLSIDQQVDQCCGLAAASNNASLVRFYNTLVNITGELHYLDLNVMLQAFKKTEASYLFKPPVDGKKYVEQFGQKEFDDLKSLVDHFQTIPAKSSDECDKLLTSFDELVNQQNNKQTKESNLAYSESLAIHYSELLKKQISKQIPEQMKEDTKIAIDLQFQDLNDKSFAKKLFIGELASEIGEKIGEKLFGENMSTSRVDDTKAIVAHLKDIILPSLSDKELQQSNECIEKIVGEVITSNALWQNHVNKDQRGLAQFYYDNATEFTKVGILSGGIQLNHVKLQTLDCSQINKVISSAISVNSLQIS